MMQKEPEQAGRVRRSPRSVALQDDKTADPDAAGVGAPGRPRAATAQIEIGHAANRRGRPRRVVPVIRASRSRPRRGFEGVRAETGAVGDPPAAPVADPGSAAAGAGAGASDAAQWWSAADAPAASP
jgi:hypothetical protein